MIITIGMRILAGVFSREANTPTKGRFRTTRITLPIYMLATSPQNTFGWLVIRVGPGCTP